jgi:hypothetical protein
LKVGALGNVDFEIWNWVLPFAFGFLLIWAVSIGSLTGICSGSPSAE